MGAAGLQGDGGGPPGEALGVLGTSMPQRTIWGIRSTSLISRDPSNNRRFLGPGIYRTCRASWTRLEEGPVLSPQGRTSQHIVIEAMLSGVKYAYIG